MTSTCEKKLLGELEQVQQAIELIELGARMQVLESEFNLARGRLLRLYKEVKGEGPPKGLLPYSTDWFMTWMPNIHASLFYGIYRKFHEQQNAHRLIAFTKAYRIYKEQTADQLDRDGEHVLSFTRAWILLRYFESDMLQLSHCGSCELPFVNHKHAPDTDYQCGICNPPSRAGKPAKQTKPASVRAHVAACESLKRLSI